MRPRVGLISFSESRNDVYEARKPMMDEEIARIKRALDGDLDLVAPKPVRFKSDLLEALEVLRKENVDGAILHVPIFMSPNLLVMAARLLDVPVMVVGNTRPDSHSTVAFVASVGGVDQAGLKYESLLAETESEVLHEKVVAFSRAAAARARLRGTTFGVFGGRTLGISTGTADPAQWMREFGVDVQHIDQSEIVRRAGEIPESDVERHTSWLTRRVGKVEYDGGRLTPATLANQVRSYLATRRMISEMQLDFIGVKCQTELSDHYALQCVNCALCNDPYDADGSKAPVACSCEADHDGALTMHILKLVSGGRPTALLDIRRVPDEGPVVLPNCGTLPTWFAARSDNPDENLAEVYLLPHAFGRAGGAAVQFVCAAGPVTMARLARSGGRYHMVIVRGSTRKLPRETLRETSWVFPHAFLEGSFSGPELLTHMKANHLHMTAGNHVETLEYFCRIMGLEYTILG